MGTEGLTTKAAVPRHAALPPAQVDNLVQETAI